MTKSAVPRRHLPSSPFKAPVEPPLRQFSVGDRVSHDEHGLGRVVGIEEGIAVLVDFGSVQKRILSPYTKLAAL
ncbi:CarD family transcriptional regulator [Streptomyces sp. NPDC055254]|uniref:CarD family transcriptional regulator n=1 Tax=Streptomyces sp. NPDC058662 TaxID=3346583 RepID=UPI00364FDB88